MWPRQRAELTNRWRFGSDANRAAALSLKALLAGTDSDAPPAEATSPTVKRRREEDVDGVAAAAAPGPTTPGAPAVAAAGAAAAADNDDVDADANADAMDAAVATPLSVPSAAATPVSVVGGTTDGAPAAAAGDDDDVEADAVRLWEPGWKERYYLSKFRADAADRAFVQRLVRAYAEGVAWVMLYYYQGCASWKWFYPEHYSPFASDFALLGEYRPRFERGQPFRPLEQLMAVFPAASRAHIPPPLQPLMVDPASPIIDFYPTSFEIDMNGKMVRPHRTPPLPTVVDSLLHADVVRALGRDAPERVAGRGAAAVCGRKAAAVGGDAPL
jgi:5'-3' exonuclease